MSAPPAQLHRGRSPSTRLMVRERSGNKVGRPSKFRPEYVDQAFKFCLLGATDADLGRFFDVDETTINRWKKAHPEFCQSLKDGKEQADARVAQSLYRRALGWEHEAVKIVADAKTGDEHIVPYVQRYNTRHYGGHLLAQESAPGFMARQAFSRARRPRRRAYHNDRHRSRRSEGAVVRCTCQNS